MVEAALRIVDGVSETAFALWVIPTRLVVPTGFAVMPTDLFLLVAIIEWVVV